MSLPQLTMRRWAPAALAVAGLAGTALVGTASAAQADPNPRTCVAQGSLSFSPGLRTAASTQTSVTGSGILSTCLDAGGLTGLTATYTVTGSGPASCLTQNFTLTQTISWNNGNTSVVALQAAAGAAGIGAYTGVVQSGELAGVTVAFATIPNDLTFLVDCALPGGAGSVSLLGDETFLAV